MYLYFVEFVFRGVGGVLRGVLGYIYIYILGVWGCFANIFALFCTELEGKTELKNKEAC